MEHLRARPFLERVLQLPFLGLGVSTEYGAHRAPGALDIFALAHRHPARAAFLELGVEVEKGLDDDATRWLAEGRACTYHFLDVNFDDDADFTPEWLAGMRTIVDQARPAWLCGDAGLWHFGARAPGQMLLLPPILTLESAQALAGGIRLLRDSVGLEVLPENPPGTAFVGDLHLLEYFAAVAEAADTGLLLDVAHLAMFQHVTGRDAIDGLADFCAERVVEIHIAGGTVRDVDGFSVIDDSHGVDVLPATWAILEALLPRATNLKAVVFECERNRNADLDDAFADLEQRLAGWGRP